MRTDRTRRTPPQDPVRKALLRAADTTEDDLVADWLRDLAQHGESASGDVRPQAAESETIKRQ
jgi:hypothetical protein